MKLKRLAGIGLALIVVVSGFSVSFGAESSNVISQWTVTTENAQAKDTYAVVLTDTDVSAYDASYIGYAVEGGYIYYYSDGEIADASKSVTNVVIPDEIGGVKITSIGLGALRAAAV